LPTDTLTVADDEPGAVVVGDEPEPPGVVVAVTAGAVVDGTPEALQALMITSSRTSSADNPDSGLKM
jgi:hypothetical protein